mmetsp:Transcript_85755/g.251067  ORF Transcript_85755/g.251067 Transcript_85755/m.251067 type:complete len:630 (+) Transcript_85755:83-1972(+)
MYATGGWVQAAPQYGWTQPGQQVPVYGDLYGQAPVQQPQVQPGQVPVYGDLYGQAPLQQSQVYAPQYGFSQPQGAYQWSQPVQQAPMPAQQVDPVDIFMQELGIEEYEFVHFGWIADYGLQDDVLPPGWTSHTDNSSGRIFYADSESGTTSWENPIADCLRLTIDLGRQYLQAPSETFFEDQMALLWDQHKRDLDAWHGPMTDDEGRYYYINSSNGVSSRQDPRQNTQFYWEVERTILETLRDTLVVPDEPEGLPNFGLSDEELLSRLETPDVYRCDAAPELESTLGESPSQWGGTAKRASQLQMEMARERTEQAGRVHREDLKAAYQQMIKSLDGIDYVIKDEAEAQRMLMTRKLRERRDRRRRREQEEHERRYGEEWKRSLEAMEVAKREEEARKKAEADAEEVRKAELFRQQQEEEKIQGYAARKEKMLQLRKKKEEEVFQQKQQARNAMIEAQARRLADMQNDEDERVERQVQEKAAHDERKRLQKADQMARWESDVQSSRAQQLERKRAQRERERAEDVETARFLGEWCKVLDTQEQEEFEMKKAAGRKLAQEHKKQVEVSRRRREEDKRQEAMVAIHAKKALEADTVEFHTYAEKCIRGYSEEGKNVIPLIKELREFRKRVLE